jgi:hypothetical protein
MKKKTKFTLAATTLMILSLTIITPRIIPQEHPQIPEVHPVSALVNSSRDNTPPLHDKAVVSNKHPETSSQSADLPEPTATEPIVTETTQPQPTEKEKTDTTPTPTTQTATKPTTPQAPISIEPKNGDTRIVDGKQQGYLLGFGWVDYMGENEVIYCEDMYENGNKVGIMD